MTRSPLSERCLERVLRTVPMGVMSTYSQEAIHAVPIVFVNCNGYIWSPIDGKPKTRGATNRTRLQRLENLERDSRFSLLIQNYQENWADLWWIRLTGNASVVGRDDIDDWETLEQALLAKYPQYASTPLLSADRQLLKMGWHEVTAWAAGGLKKLEQQYC